MEFERPLDHCDLMRQPLVIDSCAATDDLGGFSLRKRREDSRGRSRIPDAHLADAEQTVLQLASRPGQPNARLHRRNSLLTAHGRFPQETPRTRRHLAANHGRHVLEWVVDAHVHHQRIDVVLATKHIDRRTSTDEVTNHLPRHLARIGAHVFFCDAVVAAEHKQTLARRNNRITTACHAVPQGDFFKTPQAAARLRQPVEPVLNARRQLGVVDRGNCFDRLVEMTHGSLFEARWVVLTRLPHTGSWLVHPLHCR